MSYVNANEVLPDDLVQEIQKYLDGQLLYIPRKQSNAFSWGEKSGIRDKMAERNRQIQVRFHSGAAISELSDEYCLSEKRIQGIIHADHRTGARCIGTDHYPEVLRKWAASGSDAGRGAGKEGTGRPDQERARRLSGAQP